MVYEKPIIWPNFGPIVSSVGFSTDTPSQFPPRVNSVQGLAINFTGKMAQLLRPLILSPASKRPLSRCINYAFFSIPPDVSTGSFTHRRLLTSTSPTTLIHRKNLHVSRSRGLRPADAPLPPELSQSDGESDSERKSRNLKKHEARRSVTWGMELAKFSESQIKRVLRVVSLEEEVFEALMLVKRLGRDVREGKRRQFSYIGRLLRDVEPELMVGLINALKDGDQKTFQKLSDSVKPDLGDTSEEEEETDHEDEEELVVVQTEKIHQVTEKFDNPPGYCEGDWDRLCSMLPSFSS
ncbi:hypothetical protein SSX86_003364 [Deinandra increscens subsp. villosa]|uniref:Uncharacterized protein n=1 Tax=Deinandra increscens subsp. villosa TaxID=3103831 RepID=A0AAP0H9V0_9ASTR